MPHLCALIDVRCECPAAFMVVERRCGENKEYVFALGHFHTLCLHLTDVREVS